MPGLIIGVGLRPSTSTESVRLAIREVLSERMDGRLTGLATLDRRAREPVLRAIAVEFGVPLHGYSAAELATVAVGEPSSRTAAAVGAASVAEAAALLAADGGRLVIARRVSQGVVVAVAEHGCDVR
ncbi:cobalamin biosynthesis protein [Nocardia callitridis]|uniref:CobE/GbiG C-terminal domain-containing protein n=1 Tax=Nocardia callitridis TaxID=648753 RepID=A0ABP9KFG8_9NOCA